MFQSTHPRGVRHHLGVALEQAAAGFQSTHPRGVRLHQGRFLADGSNVSIHAPAWGATMSKLENDMAYRVSIHAPAWGATPDRACRWPNSRFQSTHPRGVRRSKLLKKVLWNMGFQSTHPRGVRRQGTPQLHAPHSVSIHAPAWGATRRHFRAGPGGKVSIHAPAWGATIMPANLVDLFSVSIHAPAWGATVSMFYPVDSRD